VQGRDLLLEPLTGVDNSDPLMIIVTVKFAFGTDELTTALTEDGKLVRGMTGAE
jgi:hypothetical protein